MGRRRRSPVAEALVGAAPAAPAQDWARQAFELQRQQLEEQRRYLTEMRGREDAARVHAEEVMAGRFKRRRKGRAGTILTGLLGPPVAGQVPGVVS